GRPGAETDRRHRGGGRRRDGARPRVRGRGRRRRVGDAGLDADHGPGPERTGVPGPGGPVRRRALPRRRLLRPAAAPSLLGLPRRPLRRDPDAARAALRSGQPVARGTGRGHDARRARPARQRLQRRAAVAQPADARRRGRCRAAGAPERPRARRRSQRDLPDGRGDRRGAAARRPAAKRRRVRRRHRRRQPRAPGLRDRPPPGVPAVGRPGLRLRSGTDVSVAARRLPCPSGRRQAPRPGLGGARDGLRAGCLPRLRGRDAPGVADLVRAGSRLRHGRPRLV
ncbi:MAG: Dihydroorotate dehydrogenase (NAD(+)), electron transfer subunit, partial [uncultured Thermomicrobiales bacterium]